jgi:hypothetical protein
MVHSLMFSNKQMIYKVVLLIQLNNVQQSITKCIKKMKVVWTLNMQVLVILNYFLSFFLLFLE